MSPGPDGTPDEELLAELRRLDDLREGPPTADDMTELGRYGTGSYYRRWPSWDEALRAAGIETRNDAETDADGANEKASEITGDCPWCGRPLDRGERQDA